MRVSGRLAGAFGVAVAALCLAMSAPVSTAGAAVTKSAKRPHPPVAALALSTPGSIGSFTPATSDARLAAAFARGSAASFRFTPARSPGGRRAVTVAVRAQSSTRAPQHGTAVEVASINWTPTSVAPNAYNLGLSVGWERFAISGDVAHIDAGALPGSREQMDVGLSYGRGRWNTKLSLGSDRSLDTPYLAAEQAYQLDLGGSYSLTRNLDVTGGVRYRSQHDRFDQILDNRRDSQSVYVGTAFRF